MLDYRLFFMGRDGHIVGSETFQAPNDQAAVEHASRIKHPHALELWHRASIVKRFDHAMEPKA